MYVNENNARSLLTSNIWTLDTAIPITAWEWDLWKADMVACLEHYENEICVKREIIKIISVAWDSLVVERWFAECVINDSTKEQWSTAQEFVVWDSLSLYLSKELRESITNWLVQNIEDIETMQNNVATIKNCIDTCCNSRIQQVQVLNDWKFTNWWFWDASDWDCIMQGNVFLCANKVYNFRNLTICSWACVRFEWQWVPQIKVQDHYINNWVIDTRAWYLKGCSCSRTVCFDWGSIINQLNPNNDLITQYLYWGWGCWINWPRWWSCWSWVQNGSNWTSWSSTAWWNGWAWWCWWASWCYYPWWNWCPASWENGWNWWGWSAWPWWSCWSWLVWWGWGWWGWGWRFWNGWNGWDGWGWWWNPNSRAYHWGDGWNGWNSWLRGCWWCWGTWWGAWATAFWWVWWKWWDGYIWWNGWTWWASYTLSWWNTCHWWTGWNGWKWIICWWNGWIAWTWCWWWQCWWNWWDAITNIYWLVINARCVSWTGCIRACWWNGWNWWTSHTWRDPRGTGWNWWNGANWWEVLYVYMHWKPETICVNGWAWWCWGCWVYWSCWWTDWTPWTAWLPWKLILYKPWGPTISNLIAENRIWFIWLKWTEEQLLPDSVLKWQKTIVRYSTTWYPKTINDWSLAVESTVKNQYQNTFFQLTWLSDNTTYYFTAFAIDTEWTLTWESQTALLVHNYTPWVYHNTTEWLITIVQDDNNMITLCDKNEWASWVNKQWCVYQRWNNYWFPATWSIPTTTSQINASWYWPWNYFCRNCFIYDGSWTNRDWSSVRNDNLRWWVTNTNEARRWPLAEWFHIPSPQNYRDMINIFCWAVWRSLTYDDTKNLLFFMDNCWRAYNNTSVCSATFSSTWMSSCAIYDAYIAASEYYNCAPTATNYLNRRWTWYQIRAFKNTPEMIDETRCKLA